MASSRPLRGNELDVRAYLQDVLVERSGPLAAGRCPASWWSRLTIRARPTTLSGPDPDRRAGATTHPPGRFAPKRRDVGRTHQRPGPGSAATGLGRTNDHRRRAPHGSRSDHERVRCPPVDIVNAGRACPLPEACWQRRIDRGGDRRGRHRVVAERPPMRRTRRATDSARHRAAYRVYQACVFRAPRRRWDPVSKRHRMRRARRGVGCLGLAVAAPFANQITSRVTCAQKLSLELILLLTSLKPQRCRSRSSTAHELQDAHRCAVRVLNRNAARFLSTRAVRALTRISEGAQTPMLCNEYDE